MKTLKKTPASSSVKELNFHFPKSWRQLNQKQLRSVLVMLSAYPATTALVRITCFFANLIIINRISDGIFTCKLITPDGEHTIRISSVEVSAMTEAMQWVLEPGDEPVLLEEMRGCHSVDIELHNVEFSSYLALENLYQGYLMSGDKEAVEEMAHLVYPAGKSFNLKDFEIFAICQWFTQVKGLFARTFPNFFKPVTAASDCSMADVMNAEILALTGGDITKEDDVLSKDTWRALTYLDAKAREAEEFRNSMNK